MKKAVCIMQPYFLPYLGYFALAARVQTFVFFDSAQYVRRGWMNRNRIPSSVSEGLNIQIPVRHASRESLFKDIEVSYADQWQARLRRTLDQTYRKAPHFEVVSNLLSPLYSSSKNLIDFNEPLITNFARHLGLHCEWVRSSQIEDHFHKAEGASAQDRILKICKAVGAEVYWNLPGGVELYDHRKFLDEGIELRFITSPNWAAAGQRFPRMGPWSVLDQCMWHSPEELSFLIEEMGGSNGSLESPWPSKEGRASEP